MEIELHWFHCGSVSKTFTFLLSCMSLLFSCDLCVALTFTALDNSVGWLLHSHRFHTFFRDKFALAVVFSIVWRSKPSDFSVILFDVPGACLLPTSRAVCLQLGLQELGFRLLESHVVFLRRGDICFSSDIWQEILKFLYLIIAILLVLLSAAPGHGFMSCSRSVCTEVLHLTADVSTWNSWCLVCPLVRNRKS